MVAIHTRAARWKSAQWAAASEKNVYLATYNMGPHMKTAGVGWKPGDNKGTLLPHLLNGYFA